MASVSFVGKLDTGEVLAGTPTVVEQVTSDLTLDNISINTAAHTINGLPVPIGQAVRFQVQGAVENTVYQIRVTAVSNSTPPQTLVVDCYIGTGE